MRSPRSRCLICTEPGHLVDAKRVTLYTRRGLEDGWIALEHPVNYMRKAIFLIQTGLVSIGVGLAILIAGTGSGVAALYGGATALVNTWMLDHRVDRANHAMEYDTQRGLIILYVGAVVRFVFVLAALAVGMGVLRLSPLPMVGNFVGAQMVFMLASATFGRRAKI